MILNRSKAVHKKGDRVEISGYIEISENGDIFSFCTDSRLISRGCPEPAIRADLRQLADDGFEFCEVRVLGTVIDSFKDELDSSWNWLRLADRYSERMCAFHDKTFPTEKLDALIGAEAEVCGILVSRNNGTRSFQKPYLELLSNTELNVLKKAPSDPFESAEECKYLLQKPIGRNFDHLRQYRTSGVVVAVWKKANLCLRIGPNRIVRVQLRNAQKLPEFGSRVTVAGFVRRGLFFSTIVNARYRLDGRSEENEKPAEVSASTIFRTISRNWSANAFYDGHFITTTADVRNVSDAGNDNGRMLVSSEGYDFTVQIGPMTPPPIGSTVKITGLCLITTEQDPNGTDIERMNGVMIIPRNTGDIRIISMPPWLTPGRLLGAIAALIAAIVTILIWTAHLKRIIAKRSRELANEQLATAEATFKINERTRLAVEIHDSLSQTLSALSMQLGAIRRFADTDRKKMLMRISLALKSLKSCRSELKNCLWALRSDALDEKNLNNAIRKTLALHLDDTVELKIRFALSREKLTDNTTHSLLSIIRELAVNAIHHGKADVVRIAGALEGGMLKFSVSDNGCGFDTANALGIADGHFGLQGVTERVENLGGEVRIESSPGRGTHVAITVPLPRQMIDNEQG